MKFMPVLTASFCCFLLGCSTSKKSDNISHSGRSYHRLFIICNTGDISARIQLEKDLAASIMNKGYGVVKSIDILPPSLTDPKPPTKEQITDSLNSTGCDALIVMNLKKKEELNYNPGVKVNGTTPWLGGILASGLGYAGPGGEIKGVDKPGSFAYRNGFHITCDLVDAKTLAIVYSTTSEIIDFSKLQTLGKVYITGLVNQLETRRILRK